MGDWVSVDNATAAFATQPPAFLINDLNLMDYKIHLSVNHGEERTGFAWLDGCTRRRRRRTANNILQWISGCHNINKSVCISVSLQ